MLWGLVIAERAWHLFREDGQLAEAEAKYQRALEFIRSGLSESSLDYRETAREYAALLRTAGRANEAQAIERKTKARDKSIP